MVSSVTVLVLLLLVSWAAVQARQVLDNSDMNGCFVASQPLTGWTGNAGCGPSGDQPCSVNPGGQVEGGPTPGPTDCAAKLISGFSLVSQKLALTGSEAPGLYDFQAYWGCFDFLGGAGGPSSCTFSLTIDETPITPLSGTTTKPGSISPDTFTPVTATGISITNPIADVSINCIPSGDAACYVTQATLTQQGSVVGDPHFVGLDGQRFDIQGQPHSAYSLLSDFDLQVCVSPLSVSPFPSFSAIS